MSINGKDESQYANPDPREKISPKKISTDEVTLNLDLPKWKGGLFVWDIWSILIYQVKEREKKVEQVNMLTAFTLLPPRQYKAIKDT